MKALLILYTLLMSFDTLAANQTHDGHVTDGAIQLPDDIRQLLIEEMQAVRKGMESLVFAQAAAQWHEIASIADNINNSYILKKKLSQKQMEQLHHSLPEGFRELDARFHSYAKMLSHVAHEKDIGLVNYYVFRMTESCTSCHAKYAKHRFDGFVQPGGGMQHNH